jgi:glycosyltransferase involved in cell wall biosynthesis
MSSLERYKGFDEVIEVLPNLMREVPNIAYLAVGSGTDRARLEKKVAHKGLNGTVVFTGEIQESVKSEFYQLADAYIMLSSGEGFGFVILEALASGIPVVGSSRDGTREALRGGELGILVDPRDQDAVKKAILAALSTPRGVPDGLRYFSFENFCDRLRLVLGSVCKV